MMINEAPVVSEALEFLTYVDELAALVARLELRPMIPAEVSAFWRDPLTAHHISLEEAEIWFNRAKRMGW